MKQPDPPELLDPGTLARPGPIGRIVRLLLGLLCLFALGETVYYWGSTTAAPFSTLDDRILLLVAPLCVFNYVVNIGFGKRWGQRPLLVSLAALAAIALGAYSLSGSLDNAILGTALNAWLSYFYGHLGLSFVFSAVIANPGCEMRAMPELLGRVRGVPAGEHHCPAAFMTKIDAWEQQRLHGG